MQADRASLSGWQAAGVGRRAAGGGGSKRRHLAAGGGLVGGQPAGEVMEVAEALESLENRLAPLAAGPNKQHQTSHDQSHQGGAAVPGTMQHVVCASPEGQDRRATGGLYLSGREVGHRGAVRCGQQCRDRHQVAVPPPLARLSGKGQATSVDAHLTGLCAEQAALGEGWSERVWKGMGGY